MVESSFGTELYSALLNKITEAQELNFGNAALANVAARFTVPYGLE
jgi:hypothetical protein